MMNIDTKVMKAFKKLYLNHPQVVMIGNTWNDKNESVILMYVRPDFDEDLTEYEGHKIEFEVKPYGDNICP